ncbi:hypothetical protein B0H14DRAFT_2954847, partial [Mycena olivaceomarginata]
AALLVALVTLRISGSANGELGHRGGRQRDLALVLEEVEMGKVSAVGGACGRGGSGRKKRKGMHREVYTPRGQRAGDRTNQSAYK